MRGHGGRFTQLDALRFVAIVPVLVDHVWQPGDLPWIFGGVRFGEIGVRLFLVLSGFLITGILVRGVGLDPSGSRLLFARQFYVRRILRICPIYFVCVALIVLADRAQYGGTWPWAAGFATNVYVFVHQEWPGNLGPLWSLGVQEQFYLVWPWAILFVPRRWLLAGVVTLFLAAPLFRFVATYDRDGTGPYPTWDFIQASPLAVADSLAIGALLALVARNGIRRGPVRVALAAYLALLALYHYGVATRFAFACSDAALALVLGALVCSAAAGFGGSLGRVLTWRPLVYLGRISYGIYLLHAPIAGGLTRLGDRRAVPYGERGALFFATTMVVTIGAAMVSWHVFEQPLNGLKRFFPYAAPTRDRRPTAPLQVAPAAD